MKIEKLKMTRMHNLFIIALSAMCVAVEEKIREDNKRFPNLQ